MEGLISQTLMELELKGIVIQLSGKQYVRAYKEKAD